MGISLTVARLIRIAFAIATILSAVPALSAQDKEKTHPAKPAELLAAVSHADKIVVYDGMPVIDVGDGKTAQRILYSSVNPKDISELKQSIVIEPPKEWFRCACYPSMDITLSSQGKEIGVISVFEELTIGFSLWSSDVRLADRDKLLKWFDVRGITGPRRGVERILAREKASRLAEERWLRAMPSSLRLLWPKLMQDGQWWSDPTIAVKTSANALEPELAKEFPDVSQRIRALFGWFGSGAGPWSGFPLYEDVPAHLLLKYQAAELMSALQGTTPTDSEMEGAARFFSGYTYGALFRPKEDKTLTALIPDELKKSLFAHVLKTGDEDNIERARDAFDQN